MDEQIGVEGTVADNVLQLGREALGARAERLADAADQAATLARRAEVMTREAARTARRAALEARGQGMDAVEWLGKQAQDRPVITTLTVTAAAAAILAGCALAVWALRRR
jgi:hypothetical protein